MRELLRTGLVVAVATSVLAGADAAAWPVVDPSPSASASGTPSPGPGPSGGPSANPSASATQSPERSREPNSEAASPKPSAEPSPSKSKDKEKEKSKGKGKGKGRGKKQGSVARGDDAPPPQSRSQKAGSYTVSGGAGTGTLPSGTTVTITPTGSAPTPIASRLDNGTVTSPSGLAGSAALDARWSPQGQTSYAERGTVTYAFSRPVRNPRLHIGGMGSSPRGNIRLRVKSSTPASAAPTLTKLAGFDGWDVTDDLISNAYDSANQSCTFTPTASETRAGCGTVGVDGTVSSLTFGVEVRSTAGGSVADQVRFLATVDEDYSNSSALPAASHTLSDLKLGAASTGDSPDTVVTNPGIKGDDDADGIASWPAVAANQGGKPYSVDVALTSPAASTLSGWVDWNGNGSLEDGERADADVAAGATTAKLTWTVPNDVKSGPRPARIRLGHDATATKKAAGWADSGEVEDYTMTVAKYSKLAVGKTADTLTPRKGDDVLFTISVKNFGPDDTADAKVYDKLPEGLTYVSDDSGGAYDAASGVWSAGALRKDETKSFNLVAKAVREGEITNTVSTRDPSSNTTDTIGPDDDTASVTLNVGPASTCPKIAELTNGSFETPVNRGTVQFYGDAGQPAPNVPGWRTTATDRKIELWKGPATSGGTAGGNIRAADGAQWAELNANQVSTLYQDLSTTPGLKMNWRIFHRGRNGNDTMRVEIGSSTGTLVPQTPTGASSPEITTGNGGWQEYRGTYTVPAGQTITRFAFVSVRAAGGNNDVGNFLDNIRFGTPGCLATKKSVSRSPDRDPSHPTDVLTYTVEATNEGGDDAFDAFLRDPIPANSDYVPGSIVVIKPDGTRVPVTDATGYDGAGKRVTADIGDGSDPRRVAPNTTWKMEYKVKVARAAGGSKVINQATAGWKETPDATGTTERKTNTTTTHIAETVDIKVDVNDLTITPGSSGDVTLTTTNDGPNDAEGVTTVYEIPPGTKVDTSSLPAGCTGTEDGPVTCTVGDLAAGASKKHTFKLKVPADAAPGTTATGTATTSTTSDEPEEWKANNKDTNKVTFGKRQIALEVTKSARPNPLTVGQKVTYTVTTGNKGPSDALDVKIEDTVPANFTDVTWTCAVDGTSCGSGSGNAISTTVAKIPAGRSAVVTVTGTLKADPGTTPVRNTAEATGPADAEDTNCPDKKGPCTHEGENELGTKSLRITKTASTARPLPGQEITYTVKVENTGSVTYTGATFEDDLTDVVDDATYVTRSESADIGTPRYTAPKLTWTGDVPAGRTATITYKVKVDSPPKGNKTLKNTVTSDDPGTNCPPGSTDPKCTTGGNGIPSLKYKKVMSPKNPLPGQKVGYTVTVENDGEADYPGVKFTDDLSDVVDDATYGKDAKAVLDGADHGTVEYAKPKLTWTGDLAKGKTVTVTYSATVDAPPKGDKKLKNTVTSDVPGSNCPPGSTDPDCTSGAGLPDLKFKKAMSPKSPLPGQKVTYTVTVENAGKGAYPDVKFTDDLSGVVDDATYGDDAKAVSNGADDGTVAYTQPKLTWTGDLAAGQTVTVTYSVTVGAPPKGDKKLKNTVTSDVPGSNCPPGSRDPDCSTEAGLPSLKYKKTMAPKNPLPGQKVSYTVTVENDGEAAYPGVRFTDDLSDVVDDATYGKDAKAVSNGAAHGDVGYTRPKLTWEGDLAKGQVVTVTYSVTVDAPPKGNKVLKNTVTSDVTGSNCPPGSTDPDCTTGGEENGGGLPSLKYKKTMSPKNPLPGQKVSYTVTVTNDGKGDYPGVKFTDDLSDVVDDATYGKDEKAVLDGADHGTVEYAKPKLTWTGDLGKGRTVTVTYSVTVDSPPKGNKVLKNTVTSDVSGSNCPPGSKDPDCTSGDGLPDLKLAKSMSPRNPVPGQKVTYTVTLENDGKGAYPGAKFTDDLSGVLDDAKYNNDAKAVSNGAEYGTAAYNEPRLSWTGNVAAGQRVTLTYSVTVGDPPTGDKKLKNKVTSDVPGTNCPPDAPPKVPCALESDGIPSLKYKKVMAPKNPLPGQKVSYTVTVENDGEGPYPGVRFTDDLTDVVDDATYGDDGKALLDGRPHGTVEYREPKLRWTGDLAKGQKVTVTYSVTVDSPPKGNKVLKNTVTSDVSGSNCPPGSKDPECTTGGEGEGGGLPSLRIKKVMDPEKPLPGQKVSYTVTVENDGKGDYPGVTFHDDLSEIIDDATYNQDEKAVLEGRDHGTVEYREPRLRWTGDLAKGQRLTLTYSVTVHSPPEGDKKLRNTVTSEVPGSNCPPGSKDPDCSTGGGGGLPRLKYKKVMSPTHPSPGGKVTYTITVENDGEGPYPDVKFSDDLSDVVDDATYNGDAVAVSGGKEHGTTAYARPKLTWTGDLAAGQVVTVTYSVTVGAPPKGDRVLKNTVTSEVPGSNCPPGSKDPDCSTGGEGEGQIPVIRFEKTADPGGPATAGGRVTYTVKVINDGRVTFTGATFTDDLSGVLDDARYNGDASATSGDVGYAEPKVTWTGDVPGGGTVTVTYSITVDNPVRGDKRLTNVVTSSTQGTNCPLPMPHRAAARRSLVALGPVDPDCSTGPTGIRQLTVGKEHDAAAEVKPGGRVTYTITVRNSGSAPYEGARISDDLSGVLDDASYNGDARATAGTVRVDGSDLTWSGDLAPGRTATITYSVTVKPKGSGDGRLVNRVVTPIGSGGNCPPGSTDPECTGGEGEPPVVVDPKKPVLPETGDSRSTLALAAAGAAVLLLAAGVVIVTAVRRRRDGIS